MSKEIKPGIYYVGAKDWNVRNFHGYKTSRGTTYNAFLIIDEKITLIDTVKESCMDEMLLKIEEIIDPSKIDCIVSNHVEMDHSGGLPKMMELTGAELITSKAGAMGLKKHYDTSTWNIKAVASNEDVSIGKRTLTFVHTPMVHWPDSMVTYIKEDKILLPNDAFGQHYASEGYFDDEMPLDTIMEEASKYYANIVLPYGGPTGKALGALSGLEIDMIAPSHGVIWRKHIDKILNKYQDWSQGKHQEKAVVIYDSMWGATEKMANTIRFELERKDIPVIFRSLKCNHVSDIINDILEAKYVFIGSPTLNNMVLPSVAACLSYIEGLKPTGKIGFAFGSYGWNAKTIEQIESMMTKLKWEMPAPSQNIKFQPDESELQTIKNQIEIILNK